MATIRKVAISGKFTVKITKWHVKKGQEVLKDAKLASYMQCSSGDKVSSTQPQERILKSRFEGKVSKILAEQGDTVSAGQPVIFIDESPCLHTIIMKDMCCECGADLRQEASIPGCLTGPVAAEVPMVHNIPELRVSFEEAERIARYDERQLLRAKKLALVVDLDQTLIHTTHEAVPRDIPDIFHYHLPDHPIEYHTKVRPGAKDFLEKASKLFELHIFTMGSRIYAHTIARHLDPDEKLFAHRIRSRDECLDLFSKSQDLRALFPCGDHMVCIIDDREDVWNFAPNLITVKPYKFFKGIGDINDPYGDTGTTEAPAQDNQAVEDKEAEDQPLDEVEAVENGVGKEDGPANGAGEDRDDKDASGEKNEMENSENAGETSNTKEQCDKADNDQCEAIDVEADSNGSNHPPDLDDYLYYLEEILERIHGAFYSTTDLIKTKGGLSRQDPEIARFCTPGTTNPDTRIIVPALRQQTLQGANIVFTGVVPTNVPVKNSTVYRTAVSLGAKVSDSILYRKNTDNSVTFSDDTTHVIAARLGTEKAYRASRISGIRLVGVDWLWCCSQRWERVDERLFPVPNRSRANGGDTPDFSKRGTPIHVEAERGTGNKMKPVSKHNEESVLNNKISTEEEILDSINPVTFSKDELDEMDKEVEEYMASDSDEDPDVLGSISGSSSSGRSSANSSSSGSGRDSASLKLEITLDKSRKRKKKLHNEILEIRKKRLALLSESIVNDGDICGCSSSSSSNSSGNSNLSDDDFAIGEELEKQIDY